MAWDGSDRYSRLPSNWPALVAFVKSRDNGRCTWRLPSGVRCPRRGTDVDHIVPGDNHDLRNLRLLCEHHHGRKSAREGVQGRFKRKSQKRRPAEKHPGIL